MEDGWDALLKDLARRREAAQAMGGSERLARQHCDGRLDARGGIAALFSAGPYPVKMPPARTSRRRRSAAPRSTRRAGDDAAALQLVREIQPPFGPSLLTALARLGGQPVALVANQPSVKAGAIDRNAADKAAHFIDFAGAFHLPVIFLADNPGVLAGSDSERAGLLRRAGIRP